MKVCFIVFFTTALTAFAANPPIAIPRSSLKAYRSEGLFEGGKGQRANLESLRFAKHPGFERWVVDFSDSKGHVAASAPQFQLQFIKSEKTLGLDGESTTRKPAKFIFLFRSIEKNFLDTRKLKALTGKSKHVKEIIVYPPIEQGDMAMEFVLKDDVLFEAHQPVEREGRLVLDLKSSPD